MRSLPIFLEFLSNVWKQSTVHTQTGPGGTDPFLCFISQVKTHTDHIIKMAGPHPRRESDIHYLQIPSPPQEILVGVILCDIPKTSSTFNKSNLTYPCNLSWTFHLNKYTLLPPRIRGLSIRHENEMLSNARLIVEQVLNYMRCVKNTTSVAFAYGCIRANFHYHMRTPPYILSGFISIFPFPISNKFSQNYIYNIIYYSLQITSVATTEN